MSANTPSWCVSESKSGFRNFGIPKFEFLKIRNSKTQIPDFSNLEFRLFNSYFIFEVI